jgi:thiamine biosynthesis lipoprotein
MSYRMSFSALGTENEILALGEQSEQAVLAAEARIREIDDEMSAFKPDSAVCRISASAGLRPEKVGGDVLTVLECAREISSLSGGAFDITVRPATKLWNFSHQERIPPPSEIRSLLDSGVIDWRGVAADRRTGTAYLRRRGASLDLGGIAKGYAADEAARILKEYGVRDAMLNLGGNILALGRSEGGRPWQVGVQNPLSVRGESALSLPIESESVVTSGVNEQFFIRDGVRYHHLLDPRTAFPAQSGLLSATVLAPSSMRADALSTAAFVLGPEKGAQLVQKVGARAVFILENGKIYATFPIGR